MDVNEKLLYIESMPSIYLETPLPPEEIASLRQEFPHYDLLDKIEKESDWRTIEVMYGNHLSEQQLAFSPRLRWIHCPSTDIEGLCMPEILKKGNVLVTLSKGQNVPQIAEFVIGAVLAFAKQFFHWPQAPHSPTEFWDWPLKETMWTLKDKIFLQIGLGEVGSAIVKLANSLGMNSWGVRRQRSFHPYCHKTFPIADLHSLLPKSDIVVLALPKQVKREHKKMLFSKKEFELMKNDSIFIVVGSATEVDEGALVAVAKTGKFRGVLLDAFQRPPPSKDSPLWEIPNGILSPSVASYPESEEHLPFRLFRRNLRLFIPGKINEMKNLVLS